MSLAEKYALPARVLRMRLPKRAAGVAVAGRTRRYGLLARSRLWTAKGELMAKALDVLEKFPGETRKYTFDFSLQPELAAGETLSGPTVVATPGAPGALTITGAAVSGATVTATIAAGTAGTTYTLTCTVSTSGGAVLQGLGKLLILDATTL